MTQSPHTEATRSQTSPTLRRLFVTGTNTDVGKTVITRALVRLWRRRGLHVRAMKPVESGVPRDAQGVLCPSDGRALAQAAGHAPLVRYALPDPVSPHLAAARAGVSIDLRELIRFVEDNEDGADIAVIEGAGGFLVPLGSALFADLAAALDCALLIVAPDALGAINATLLTIEAARSRGVAVAGVIFNRAFGPADHLDNAAAVARYGGVPVLGAFPQCAGDDDALADAAAAHLAVDDLLRVD